MKHYSVSYVDQYHAFFRGTELSLTDRILKFYNKQVTQKDSFGKCLSCKLHILLEKEQSHVQSGIMKYLNIGYKILVNHIDFIWKFLLSH